MTEKKQENSTESPSTADSHSEVAEAIEEADYNNDKAWNYFPLPSNYYEIKDAWGYR